MSRPLAEVPELAELVWADDPAEGGGPPQDSQPTAPCGDSPQDPPPVREVLKAGWWDRSSGDGGGFAAGGVADRIPPGPVLAGLAGDLWDAGLGRLTDDQLIGVMGAARRLEAWAAGMKLAAVGDLWRRRAGEQDAGDSGVADHADSEIAAALTLTSYAAGNLLDLAIALDRLPLTASALAAGDIDLPRARVITSELAGLTDQHAAGVEAAIIGAAAGQTTGQLGQAARRAVIAADPTAARKRKEQALREARVERWTEHAGTAALAGRDLPPLSVLAADHNLTALAQQLKDAGCEGTMDTLRAQAYLALLTSTPASALLPTTSQPGGTPANTPEPTAGQPGDTSATTSLPDSVGSNPGTFGGTSSSAGTGGTADGANAPPGPSREQPTPGDSAVPAGLARPFASGHLGIVPVKGSVNLTLPLATWLGLSEAPGHASGYGFLDATDSRALAAALATQPGTKWCITLTGPGGRPAAHGCARTGPPAAPPGT